MASHSTPVGEAHQTDGSRRMALSDTERAGGPTRALEESKGQTAAPVDNPCYVYVLRCADGSLYVGATADVRGREKAHNDGFGSEHTSRRRPVQIVYSECHRSWAAARKREAQLKRWPRAKKQALVEGDQSRLHLLSRGRS